MPDKIWNPKTRKGLIDGDILLYACGWVADKEERDLEGAHEVLDEMLLNIRDNLELDDAVIFLSDSTENNYRTDVAVTHPYKGNRTSEKPAHFEALRDYIQTEWGARVVKGAEADDGMGKMQSRSTIICTIDKDLDMIPGWHFNWKRFTMYYVNTIEAQRHFWTQMLTGDRTDNIFAIKGIGPKKAEKLIGDVPNEWLMYTAVHKQYCEEFGAHAGDRFYENYKLLKIQGAPVNFGEPAEYEPQEFAEII